MSWLPAPGVLELPSGRRVRGRSVRRPAADSADFSLYLLTFRPRDPSTGARDRAYAWLRWPDFGLPIDRRLAVQVFAAAYARVGDERVEVCCGGGIGRTGTALACLAILDGMEPEAALAHVRNRYHPQAVETPWQRRFLIWYANSL